MAESVPAGGWGSVASSADGCSLVAAATSGIYVWKRTATPWLNTTQSNGSLVLSWILPSQPFVLRQTTDLAAGNWTNTPASPTLNSATLRDEVTVPLSGGTMFYRLESQ